MVNPMRSDYIRKPPAGYNTGKCVRYYDRCAYGYPLTNKRYELVKDGDPIQLHVMMIKVCKQMFHAEIPERYYTIIYDGNCDIQTAVRRRDALMKSAIKYDKKYPSGMWMTLSLQLGGDVEINYFNTLEALLTKHFYGQCSIDCTTGGNTRIVRGTSITRIFYIPPVGVAEYRKLMFSPRYDDKDKQKRFVCIYLFATRGFVLNPGRTFLGKGFDKEELKNLGLFKKRYKSDEDEICINEDRKVRS